MPAFEVRRSSRPLPRPSSVRADLNFTKQGKEDEHNWAGREVSMDKVRGMLMGNAFAKFPAAFVAGLRSGWMAASLKGVSFQLFARSCVRNRTDSVPSTFFGDDSSRAFEPASLAPPATATPISSPISDQPSTLSWKRSSSLSHEWQVSPKAPRSPKLKRSSHSFCSEPPASLESSFPSSPPHQWRRHLELGSTLLDISRRSSIPTEPSRGTSSRRRREDSTR